MHANRITPFRLIFFIFLLITVGASAQNAPNSLSPGKSKEVGSMLQTTTTKSKKKHRTGVFSPRRQNVKHTARYEFYERIEQAAKEKQRILRRLAKPQYSDPRYFGHKRIPKRRPANKLRYCGECGIRH
jgi:hypothetical protein